MSSNHITVNSLVSRKSKDLYNSTIHTTEFLNEQRTRIDIISYIYKQPRSMGTETNVKLMSTESVMPSNHLIFCRPFLLLPSIFPSITVFSNESVLRIRWPKYWSFSISRSNEYSGLISFRIDWFDLLAVQETLQSLLQHHSSKA